MPIVCWSYLWSYRLDKKRVDFTWICRQQLLANWSMRSEWKMLVSNKCRSSLTTDISFRNLMPFNPSCNPRSPYNWISNEHSCLIRSIVYKRSECWAELWIESMAHREKIPLPRSTMPWTLWKCTIRDICNYRAKRLNSPHNWSH